jgi:hypothetical protein
MKFRAACCLLLLTCPPARAQTLPTGPLTLAGGRVTFGGDIAASYGSDDPGFYNYTDYGYSSLRRIRGGISGVASITDRLAVLGEVRLEGSINPNAADVYVQGFYLQVRPWRTAALEINAGQVPPTFGAFGRRTSYGLDNPLIGYPLGYQYLTSLRADAIPATANELLIMRGRGWRSSYSLGDPLAAPGVALADGFKWDTGVQVSSSNDRFEALGSITRGTLANPLFDDDNDGLQFAGRFTFRPVTGLKLGTSVSRGDFVASAAVDDAAAWDQEPFTQIAWGADAEYSRGYYLVRFETILSQWTMPEVNAPLINRPLDASSVSVEGRYKILPGLYAAARYDWLGFSTIQGSISSNSWDARVTRVEVGAGYSLQRNLLLKGSYQHNTRRTSFEPTANLVAAEILFWF